MRDLKPYDLMLYLRDRMKYRESLVHFADFIKADATTFLSQFDELLIESERFETMTEWNDYVEECKKTLLKNIEKNKKEGVFLSTFHGAKGLEWELVFIISANEGTTPLMRNSEIENPEEERRLFYVAMTRAMSDLRIFAFEEGNCKTRYFQEIF
jgi:DNA helicase-2/ATP-dependent DNA helicase PcrA